MYSNKMYLKDLIYAKTKDSFLIRVLYNWKINKWFRFQNILHFLLNSCKKWHSVLDWKNWFAYFFNFSGYNFKIQKVISGFTNIFDAHFKKELQKWELWVHSILKLHRYLFPSSSFYSNNLLFATNYYYIRKSRKKMFFSKECKKCVLTIL